MKNIIFMVAFKKDGQLKKEYQYSIDSWRYFCKKYNAELLLMEDPVVDISQMNIIWQRYFLFDILDANEINYDQVLMVDADTIVHPDCPNFFNETDQTPLNYMLRKHKVDLKLLPWKYNMGGMAKREIIGDDMLHTKMGYVMHFNGLPGKKEEVVPYWIEKTYKYLYEN